MSGGECGVLNMCARLTTCAVDGYYSNAVDIFDATTGSWQLFLGSWSTATLSVPRYSLAATSLPNLGLAIFAGGQGTCFRVALECCGTRCFVRGMHERGGVWCVEDVCASHACRRWCCGLVDCVRPRILFSRGQLSMCAMRTRKSESSCWSNRLRVLCSWHLCQRVWTFAVLYLLCDIEWMQANLHLQPQLFLRRRY